MESISALLQPIKLPFFFFFLHFLYIFLLSFFVFYRKYRLIYILKMVEAEIRQRNVASKQPDNVNPFTADKIDDEDKKRGLSSATLIFILVGGVAALIFIVSPLLYFFNFYLDACRRAQKELFTPSKHQRKGYRNVGISPIIFLNFSLF